MITRLTATIADYVLNETVIVTAVTTLIMMIKIAITNIFILGLVICILIMDMVTSAIIIITIINIIIVLIMAIISIASIVIVIIYCDYYYYCCSPPETLHSQHPQRNHCTALRGPCTPLDLGKTQEPPKGQGTEALNPKPNNPTALNPEPLKEPLKGTLSRTP